MRYTIFIFVLSFATTDHTLAGSDFHKTFNKSMNAFENLLGEKLPDSSKPYKRQIAAGIVLCGGVGLGSFCLYNLIQMHWSNGFYHSGSLLSNNLAGKELGGKHIFTQTKIVENKIFDSSQSFVGPTLTFKDIMVNGDLDVVGNTSISGLQKTNEGLRTASTIFVTGNATINSVIANAVETTGPTTLDSVIADIVTITGPADIANSKIYKNIVVTGPLSCTNVQSEKIKVTGHCTLKKVDAKSVFIDLTFHGNKIKFCSEIRLQDVSADMLLIESNKVITVYLSHDSHINTIKFLKTQGEIILF